jgi:outer membrane immunogenic protein
MTALVVSAFALISAPVSAADMALKMPVKAPPPAPAPVHNWTGWYIGGNAGYGWSKQTDQITAIADPSLILGDVSTSVPIDASGFIGGGQIGYNWQLSPMWLAGLEADFSGADISGSNSVAGNFGRVMNANERLDWVGTLRGRVGFLPSSTFLVYATGGLAYGQAKLSTFLTRTNLGGCPSPNQCEAGSVSDTKVGWTIGGGVEWAFALNWSVRAEYLFVDLGNLSHNMTDPNFPAELFGASIPLRVNIVRAGLNYQFH